MKWSNINCRLLRHPEGEVCRRQRCRGLDELHGGQGAQPRSHEPKSMMESFFLAVSRMGLYPPGRGDEVDLPGAVTAKECGFPTKGGGLAHGPERRVAHELRRAEQEREQEACAGHLVGRLWQASALAVEPGDQRFVGGERLGVSFGEEGAHACDGNSVGMEGAGDERVWKADTTELLHIAR